MNKDHYTNGYKEQVFNVRPITMSQVVVQLHELSCDIPKNLRVTTVSVDGKLIGSVPLDAENLSKFISMLLDAMYIENSRVETK